jgi:membrane protein
MLGAALAFFASFSLFPLLLLLITAFGYLLAAGLPLVVSLKAELIQAVASVLPPAATFLERSVKTAESARQLTGIVGLTALFLSGAAFLEQFSLALDTIWGVRHERSIWKRKFLSWLFLLLMLFLFLILTLSFVLFQTALVYLEKIPGFEVIWGWSSSYLYLLLTFLILVLIYRILPAQKVSWRSALTGSFFSVALLGALNRLFAWYAAKINLTALYGPIGVFILLLLWIYLFILTLLFGAEFAFMTAKECKEPDSS